jgi:hypothetical protein
MHALTKLGEMGLDWFIYQDPELVCSVKILKDYQVIRHFLAFLKICE